LITRKFLYLSPVIYGLFITLSALAQTSAPVTGRWALVLKDEPAAAHFSSRAELSSPAALSYRRRIEGVQAGVRSELSRRKFQTIGAVSTLANAVFVTAPASRLAELKSIPGVVDVVPMHRHEALLNRATTLMNGPQAWALTSGGQSNAGAGIKIAILDTGIDQNHPAMQDPSLPMPLGFPKCSGADCAFTNNKVIVARSYIRQLAAGSDPSNPALDSRPDDFSPRDHVGHGTATASTAAGNTATGSVTINGMAPKAYVGNYRILGSPTVNDGTFDDIMILALDDAINDGMDIVSMSVAGPAFSGPLDTGAACGLAPGVSCDIAAQAFEAAAQKGMTILVAAGNSGGNGVVNYPLYNSVNSPGDAPSVIAVGATTNSHTFSGLVEMNGLSPIAFQPSDSFSTGGAVTGPLVDVTLLGDTGLACNALPDFSLVGMIALIQRGTCNFSQKMTNAVNAGASAVVFYMANASPAIPVGGLSAFSQTAVMVSLADGLNLKAHSGALTTIDPNALEVSGVTPNQLASFSSFGPALGTNGIKPDILATGESLYMPAQSYDPLGEMYSSNGYIMAAGTSFSTPLTAGAAALVKQNHPGYTAAQIKSALVNTVTQDVTQDDTGSPVTFLQTGPGRLTADQAIKSTVTVVPPTVSFGALTSTSLPASQQLTITNTGSTAENLTFGVTSLSNGGPVPTVSQSTLSLAANASSTITVSLAGTVPIAGAYNGNVTIAGGAVPLKVPYLFLVGSNTPGNLQVLSGDFDDGTVNQIIPDGGVAFQVTDANGVPVAGVPVTFSADPGIALSQVSATTDQYGIAGATVTLGPTPGQYGVTGCVTGANCGTYGYQFTEFSRNAPAITAAGVVDAASYKQPIAPGSYITIFGTGLYDPTITSTGPAFDKTTSSRLPLALDFVMVSFDVPGANPPVSVPGHMLYVSANQIAVQVPWELQGYASAQVKVTIDFTYGNVVTIPLSNFAPAFFQHGIYPAGTDLSGVAISDANPAVRGQIVTLYANGLGPVTTTPATGDITPLTGLSKTTVTPTVTVGGQPGTVSFAGLSPGSVALYQINVQIPANITAGVQPITLSVGGANATTISIPVK
jgi:minor extracellular serine protease Vpr